MLQKAVPWLIWSVMYFNTCTCLCKTACLFFTGCSVAYFNGFMGNFYLHYTILQFLKNVCINFFNLLIFFMPIPSPHKVKHYYKLSSKLDLGLKLWLLIYSSHSALLLHVQGQKKHKPFTYMSCGKLVQCPGHRRVGNGTKTCRQSLQAWNQAGLQHC